jgi:hypothetical protein
MSGSGNGAFRDGSGIPGPSPGPVGVEPLGDVALVDLLNRVLDRGVVVSGEVTISVAGIDLLYLNLSLLLSSVESLVSPRSDPRDRGPVVDGAPLEGAPVDGGSAPAEGGE